MTKLVVVLAVVVVVILVVVIVAVRNMRAEDPDEFADRPARGGAARDNRDRRDPRYDRRQPPARHPGRGNARPARRPSGRAGRQAGAAAGGFDDRRARDYDQVPDDGLGYDSDRGFDQRGGRDRDDLRTAQMTAVPQDRRRGVNGAARRPEAGQPPARARQASGRRSDDSSQWDSSEWEKLSDVDYWAELAADKPLTTTAQPAAAPAAAQRAPAQPRGARSRPGRETDAPAGRGAGPADSMPGVPAGAPRRDPVTGLPIRGRGQPADGNLEATMAGRPDFAAAPVPVSEAGQAYPLAEPRSPAARHSGPASLPRPVHSLQPDRRHHERPPVDPDDDPLTSPSFPRVPASDSRSYRNERPSTPPRGSRAPEQYPAPTEEFSRYDAPAAPQWPAGPRHTGPQRQAAQYPGDVGGDTARTHPNAYRSDPLTSRDPYAPRPPSVPPAPARSAPASNPYGSYVTPSSQPAVPGYGGYPPAAGNGNGNGNGHAPYAPPPAAAGGAQAGTDYWQHQHGPAPGGYPAPNGSGYLNGSAPASDPRHAGARPADYGNGYEMHAPAGYPPDGYPAAAPHDRAQYASDPYAPDEYGGYPGYGAAER